MTLRGALSRTFLPSHRGLTPIETRRGTKITGGLGTEDGDIPLSDLMI